MVNCELWTVDDGFYLTTHTQSHRAYAKASAGRHSHFFYLKLKVNSFRLRQLIYFYPSTASYCLRLFSIAFNRSPLLSILKSYRISRLQ